MRLTSRKGARLPLVLALVVVSLLWLSLPSLALVKNVILLIGDGMGFGAIQYARNLSVGPGGRLAFEQFPTVGLVTTYSTDQWVTDSAAAATALATGHKTKNGMIGVKPDGTEVKSVLEAAQESGRAVGLISTNTIYDATPAGFGAHWAQRSGSAAIAAQLVAKKYDVLLGGGSDQFFPKGVGPGLRTDGKNLVEEAKAAGYTYVANKTELAAASGEKLLGLFNPTYMSYLKDRPFVNSQEPSLAEMTAKALEVLSKDPDGFFLMSEGARIDHMAHTAEAAGTVTELLDFEAAVKVALRFAQTRTDTLIVVTADHDTMGLSVTEPLKVDVLQKVKASPEYMGAQMKKGADGLFTEESVRQVMADLAGITDLTPDEVTIIRNAGKLAGYKTGYEIGSVIATRANVASLTSAVRAIGGTGGHSGNQVPLYATGPDAKLFARVLDNTEIAGLLAQAMGFKF